MPRAGSTPRPLVALHWGSTSITRAVRPALAKPGGEVDGGGGLAHPTLLVGHADDLGHVIASARVGSYLAELAK